MSTREQRLAAVRDALNDLSFAETVEFHGAFTGGRRDALQDLFQGVPENVDQTRTTVSATALYPVILFHAPKFEGEEARIRSKIHQIKAVREVAGMGLKDAKDLVDELTLRPRAVPLLTVTDLEAGVRAVSRLSETGLRAFLYNPLTNSLLGGRS